MGTLRDFAYAGVRKFDIESLADKLKVSPAQTPIERELEVNRAILSLFGVKFIGKPLNVFGGSSNSSKREGYTLEEIGQILYNADINVKPEDLVKDELAYKVVRGADFTYRFEERQSSTGEKRYYLVRDSLIWT